MSAFNVSGDIEMTLFITALLVILLSLIVSDLFAGTGYTLRFFKRVWEAFAFMVFCAGLFIYCVWGWIRGKKPTNIFN